MTTPAVRAWQCSPGQFEHVVAAFRRFALGAHPAAEQVRRLAGRADLAGPGRREDAAEQARAAARELAGKGLPALRRFDGIAPPGQVLFVPVGDPHGLFAASAGRFDGWGSDEVPFEDRVAYEIGHAQRAGRFVDEPVLVEADLLLLACPVP